MSAFRKWMGKNKHGIVIGGVILLLVVGYVLVDILLINQKTETIISGGTETTLTPGTWEDGPPEETTPPDNLLASYQVAADQPRALYIDKLGMSARILPMGIDSDGSIQSPKNVFDSGWYTGSATPGQPGAAFIDGHASGATRQGLMAYLDTLVIGDTVVVEKGDGEELLYRVVNVEVSPLDGFDMNKALKVHGGAEKGLNIMTCTGTWLPDRLTYDKRVVVYTQQIEG